MSSDDTPSDTPTPSLTQSVQYDPSAPLQERLDALVGPRETDEPKRERYVVHQAGYLCTDCGVLVGDRKAHDRFHLFLNRLRVPRG